MRVFFIKKLNYKTELEEKLLLKLFSVVSYDLGHLLGNTSILSKTIFFPFESIHFMDPFLNFLMISEMLLRKCLLHRSKPIKIRRCKVY